MCLLLTLFKVSGTYSYDQVQDEQAESNYFKVEYTKARFKFLCLFRNLLNSYYVFIYLKHLRLGRCTFRPKRWLDKVMVKKLRSLN
jgi:hypothetical protein